MILLKILYSLQNICGIIQRWTEHFLNPGKRQSREILQLICHKYHEEETETKSGTGAPKKILPWKPKRFLHIL